MALQSRSTFRLLTVLSGPAGVGKNAIVEKLPEYLPQIRLVTSDTTRPIRPGEVDGVDRNFISAAQFQERAAAGHYLEWATYAGNFYGTSIAGVERILADGCLPILEIEVQGARQVMERVPDALGIFVLPPSWTALVERLSGRGTETPEVISRRLEQARAELAEADRYDFRVVNGLLVQTVIRVACLIRSRLDEESAQAARSCMEEGRRSLSDLVPELQGRALSA